MFRTSQADEQFGRHIAAQLAPQALPALQQLTVTLYDFSATDALEAFIASSPTLKPAKRYLDAAAATLAGSDDAGGGDGESSAGVRCLNSIEQRLARAAACAGVALSMVLEAGDSSDL